MISIYGAIGYTLLKNNKNKVLIFADKHDDSDSCYSDTDIADWFNKKNNSNILLEETPRNDNIILKDLWIDSYHTQKLKKLYLSKPKVIQGIDIRLYLIPYSWELVDSINNTTLFEFLKELNDFFSIKNEYCLNNLSIYKNMPKIKSKNGEHFLELKKKFYNLVKKNKTNLYDTVLELKNNKINILEKINDMLDNILEWYICASININKSNIIHTGLAHSEKIVDLLEKYYGYKKQLFNGINKLDEIKYKPMNGCIQLPNDIENQFGGFLHNI
jgi:hypothetical protein